MKSESSETYWSVKK